MRHTKKKKQEVIRYELLGVCSGIFHTHVQSRNPTSTTALVAWVTRVGLGGNAAALWPFPATATLKLLLVGT